MRILLGRDHPVDIYPERVIQQGRQANIVEGMYHPDQTPIAVKLSAPLERGYSKGTGIGDKSRFLHESDMLMRLRGVAGVPYYFGIGRTIIDDSSERIALVMQRIRGINLDQRRKQYSQHMSPTLVRNFLGVATHILAEVHDRGILHCDQKLSNWMVTHNDEVYLVDWGASQLMNQLPSRVSSKVVGTAQYISPEHITGKKMDGRADMYSLGIVAAVLLYGFKLTHRYVRSSAGEYVERPVPAITKAIAAGETIKYNLMKTNAVGIERDLQEIIRRMTAWHPGDRYASMRDVYTALDALAPN